MSNKNGLTEEELDFFRENGFVGPFTVYEEEEAITKWTRAKMEMVVSQNKPHNSTVLNYDRHLDCKTLSEHIMRPEIVEKLKSLMGDDIMCWKTNVFPKYAGEAGTGWHQVETFMAGQERSEPVAALKFSKDESAYVTSELTVWTAFTPATKENGCMTFIPGSHKSWYYDETKSMSAPIEAKRNDFFGYDYSELKIDETWNPDDQVIKEMEMKPGQFVIFTSKCVHGSLPNSTKDETRMGYAGRFVPTSVKVYDGIERLDEYGEVIDLDYHGCVLVAGEDKFKHNKMLDENLNGVPFKKMV